MTRQKDLKRLVRGRMQKTGESYTTARANLLAPAAPATRARTNGEATPAIAPPAPDHAAIAGMSDAKMKEKTGCTWEKWVWALDRVKAYEWPHRAIAEYVHETYKVPGWWTQAVAVGYERIKGLRERGQRRSGAWEASKSKTIGAPVSAVFKAFKQPKLRSAWLDAPLVIRTSVPNKSLRITWEDGTSVEVYLTAKERSKSVVAIQHTRLPDKASAERMKQLWATHLEALSRQLAKPGR